MIRNSSELGENDVLFQLLLDNVLVSMKEKAIFTYFPFYLSTLKSASP